MTKTVSKIVVADGLAEDGLAKIKALPGVEVIAKSAIEREELKSLLSEAHILVVRSRTQVDRDLLQSAGKLKLAIRAGIGLDNIDVAAATDFGVVVMNAPTGNIVTTAEHALALMFAISRRVAAADASMRAGKWDKKSFQGNEIRGKTLGVVGFGNIGKAVSERARGLTMKVVAYDPYLSEEAAARHQVRLVSLQELLEVSDYVTLHLPLTEGTRNLIDANALATMKKGSFLINCARGGIVDENALCAALEKKHLAGAALDVFEKEPLPSDSPLLTRSDVVLTPHLGASTAEAQDQVGLEVAEQIQQYLSEGALKNAINVPNVSSEQMDVLRPYLTLCERLGAFAGQATPPAHVRKVTVRFAGIDEGYDRSVLMLSALKGFLAAHLSTPVNFVNARKLLKRRGIEIEQAELDTSGDYSTLVEIRIEGETTSCYSGTIFGKSEPRIVAIDSFAIDARLGGCMLYTKNVDTPGVIGEMGSTLGKEGINIARMHLGRCLGSGAGRGEAIALISVDSELTPAQLDQLRSIKAMKSATQIRVSQ